RVGMCSPRPTRTRSSWARVSSATAPVRSGDSACAVRSRVASWMITSCPSALRCTSHSSHCEPSATPRRKERTVFSGSTAAAPRCPTSSGCWGVMVSVSSIGGRRCGGAAPGRGAPGAAARGRSGGRALVPVGVVGGAGVLQLVQRDAVVRVRGDLVLDRLDLLGGGDDRHVARADVPLGGLLGLGEEAEQLGAGVLALLGLGAHDRE